MRSSTFLRRLLYGVILTLLLFLPTQGYAQPNGDGPEPDLSVAPDDSPLIIQGTLDGETSAFSGHVRLSVTGGDVTQLRMLASDLVEKDSPSQLIERRYLSIPAGTSLSVNQPLDVQVTVSNVNHPGVYTGIIKFLLPEQLEDEALIVPVELHVDATPVVEPVEPSLSVQVVRCQNRLSCRVARWLLPENATRDDWQVLLDNQTPNAVDVTDVDVVMFGEQTGHVVRTNEIKLKVPHPLPASQVERIDLTIFRNRLPSDRYRGTFRFKVADEEQPVIVNVDLDVRDGPFWPFLLIVLGIIVGRLARDMDTPAAQTQIKLRPRYQQLLTKADEITNNEAKSYVIGELQTFITLLDEPETQEETLKQELERVTEHIDFLISLDPLMQGLPDALAAQLKPKLTQIVEALRNNDLPKAQQLQQQIEQRRQQAQADGTMGAREQFASLQTQLENLKKRAAQSWTTTKTNTISRWQRQLATISGIRINSGLRYWVIRPFLWFLLLLVLTLLGMQTLYVKAGTAFGAAGLYEDYLALFLWGLTADVVSRSLSSLTGNMAENGDDEP